MHSQRFAITPSNSPWNSRTESCEITTTLSIRMMTVLSIRTVASGVKASACCYFWLRDENFFVLHSDIASIDGVNECACSRFYGLPWQVPKCCLLMDMWKYTKYVRMSERNLHVTCSDWCLVCVFAFTCCTCEIEHHCARFLSNRIRHIYTYRLRSFYPPKALWRFDTRTLCVVQSW